MIICLRLRSRLVFVCDCTLAGDAGEFALKLTAGISVFVGLIFTTVTMVRGSFDSAIVLAT